MDEAVRHLDAGGCAPDRYWAFLPDRTYWIGALSEREEINQLDAPTEAPPRPETLSVSKTVSLTAFNAKPQRGGSSTPTRVPYTSTSTTNTPQARRTTPSTPRQQLPPRVPTSARSVVSVAATEKGSPYTGPAARIVSQRRLASGGSAQYWETLEAINLEVEPEDNEEQVEIVRLKEDLLLSDQEAHRARAQREQMEELEESERQESLAAGRRGKGKAKVKQEGSGHPPQGESLCPSLGEAIKLTSTSVYAYR